MLFTPILASALLAATALAESLIAQAQAHGVDPFGNIPSDAVRNADGSYTADEFTKSWHWIRAQGEIPRGGPPAPGLGLQKREASGIGAGFFLGSGCQGQATFYNDDIDYDVFYRASYRSSSYVIANRGLADDEEITLYWPGGDCSQEALVVPGGTPVGCYTPDRVTSCLKLSKTSE